MTIYDANLLNAWDHTSSIICTVYNLMIVTINKDSKARLKPRIPEDFHPYRKSKPSGMLVTADNIGSLKFLARGSFAKQSPS